MTNREHKKWQIPTANNLSKQYPVTFTLGFKSEEKKRAFIGQFLDGWGEGAGIQGKWDEDFEFMGIDFFDGDENEND